MTDLEKELVEYYKTQILIQEMIQRGFDEEFKARSSDIQTLVDAAELFMRLPDMIAMAEISAKEAERLVELLKQGIRNAKRLGLDMPSKKRTR